MANVLILSFTDVRSDPRVRRQALALRDQHRVTVAGCGDTPPADGIAFHRLESPGRPLPQRALAGAMLAGGFHEPYYWRRRPVRDALASLGGFDADLIIANEAECWPTALALAEGRSRRPKIIFDAHEFEPAVVPEEWRWRLFFERMNTWICRTTLHRADAVTTVSDGIAAAYRDAFGLERAVILPNAAPFLDIEPGPLLPGRIRLVHHGAAIPSRKLEVLIDTMGMLDERFSLDLMLVPDPGSRYLQRLKEHAAGDARVTFQPPVPMPDIAAHLGARYDVGVHLLAPTSLNNARALPNKLFEFLQARLGVAIGPSAEMQRVVAPYDCAVIAEDFTAPALARALDDIDDDRLQRMKAGAHRAAQDHAAERYADRLRALVDEVLAPQPTAASSPPTIDVVIPAHNAAATLADALASVASQSQPAHALIVVADRCTDATARLAADAGAQVLEVDEGSAGGARNRGLSASRADYVAFLDADDVWRPGWLAAVTQRLAEHPDVALLRGTFDEEGPRGELIRRAPSLGSDPVAYHALLVGNPVLTSASVVHRATALDLGGFDPSLRHGEDWDLWLRLADHGVVLDVDGHHVRYRRVPESLTRARGELLEQRDNLLRVLKRAFARHPVEDAMRRRATAEVLRHSAMRCLAHDAAAPARVDLRAALEVAPAAPTTWALAALTALPPAARHTLTRARQQLRTRSVDEP